MNTFTWKDIILFLLIITGLTEVVYIGSINYKLPKGKVLSESVSLPTGLITTPFPIEPTSPVPLISPFETALLDSTLAPQNVTPSPSPKKTPTPTPTGTPTPTPTPSISPLVTPTPTITLSPQASITPSPSKTPTPLPVQRASSQEINSFIDRFSSQYSVDPNVLRHIALCESGFNPLAIHLSYYGLFQFGPSTWQNIRKKMGEDINTDLRLNAEEAVQTAAYEISIGGIGIWPHCKP